MLNYWPENLEDESGYSDYTTSKLYTLATQCLIDGWPIPVDLAFELAGRGYDISELEALYDNSI